MPTLEEISEVMNPQSLLMGATGSGQLDVMMSSAEQCIQRARAECLQLQPLIKRIDGDTIAQAMAIISSEQNSAWQFLGAANQYLDTRRARAERGLKDAQVRPEISDELIVSRIHSLEILFDSLNKKDLLGRIEQELKEGDSLSRYLLRGGEGWISMYLESRQIAYSDLVTAIFHTVGIIEAGLKNACVEYLTVTNLISAFQEAKSSIESSFLKLPLEVLSWVSKKMSGNSLEELDDDHVITAADLRKFGSSGAFALSRRW